MLSNKSSIQWILGEAVREKVSLLLQEEVSLSDEQLHELGDVVISRLKQFARDGLQKPKTLAVQKFAFVEAEDLREALSKTFYRARWLYKVGLALWARGDERAAHVRVQVIDYGAICEELIRYAVQVGVKAQKISCEKWLEIRAQEKNKGKNDRYAVKGADFKSLAEICRDESIVDRTTFDLIETLRNRRNSVHLGKLQGGASQYTLQAAKESLSVVNAVADAVTIWVRKVKGREQASTKPKSARAARSSW